MPYPSPSLYPSPDLYPGFEEPPDIDLPTPMIDLPTPITVATRVTSLALKGEATTMGIDGEEDRVVV